MRKERTSKSPPTANCPGRMRKNSVPCRLSGFSLRLPMPYSPVHNPRKFSLALGATSDRSTMIIVPMSMPSAARVSHTFGSGPQISWVAF